MPRNRIIYQNEGVYVGPAPASGYSFIDAVGVLGNGGDFNLVMPLERVQSVDYNITAKYNDVQVLGKNAILYQPQIQPPEVTFGLEYLQFGILNELRLGFNANYKIEYGQRSGQSFYPDNFNVFSVSGFIATDISQTEYNDLRWPLQYRDRRNYYIALEKEGNDLNQPAGYDDLHPDAANLNVIGFGNCYINNYNARASVGDFPRCSISVIGENFKVYSSGSGLPNPAVDSKSGNLVQNRIFQIPNFQSGTYTVSTLLPGDITLDINSLPCLTGVNAVDGTGYSRGQYSQNNQFENLGIKYTDIKIQNYELNLPLPRRDLKSIGYKYPLNRVVEYPITYSFGLSCIVGDSQTGDFTQFMNQNDDYNVTVKLNNPKSAYPARTGVGVQYDMRRMKLENISYSDRIGSTFKRADLKFKGVMDPDDLTRGLFISGQINTTTQRVLKGYLLNEDGTYILQEDSSKIYIQYIEAPIF